MERKQGNVRQLGLKPRPYFGDWISRRTCYPLGNLNIPALRCQETIFIVGVLPLAIYKNNISLNPHNTCFCM